MFSFRWGEGKGGLASVSELVLQRIQILKNRKKYIIFFLFLAGGGGGGGGKGDVGGGALE